MRKFLKRISKPIFLVVIIGLLYLNLSLYYSADFDTTKQGIYNKDVYHQLQFLKSELHNGTGNDMQRLFPEGFIFINSLYGLSWVNLIEGLKPSSEIFKEGMDEINWTIEEVNSPKGKSIFRKYLPLEYGAFYKGWTNFLLGKKLSIQSEEERIQSDIDLFFKNCQQISQALKNSKTPYLESYKSATWPADVTIAVASLGLHDKIFGLLFQETLSNWVIKVKANLDSRTGLIPHSVHYETGVATEGARGSSISLILNFLNEIDEDFAKEQFKIYRENFSEKRFALPGIREYPKGKVGRGDIDSGPVILDIGGASSIVGQRTMGLYGDWDQYVGIRNCIETFGVGYTWNSKKKYIFGQLPMADAFIAWSNSIEKMGDQEKVQSFWRLKFHILTLVLVLILVYLLKHLTKLATLKK